MTWYRVGQAPPPAAPWWVIPVLCAELALIAAALAVLAAHVVGQVRDYRRSR